ncbi:hypothetical protein X777_05514 [Ooceraea biroi]|uniref:Uncharacterized protein n=1 Tax=Ooceraea biroi TaxID=2015173 RepID=A0A026WEL2_OOCBI|nr:hypothetical protein X777_05514 [Ooceraea biroi]
MIEIAGETKDLRVLSNFSSVLNSHMHISSYKTLKKEVILVLHEFRLRDNAGELRSPD